MSNLFFLVKVPLMVMHVVSCVTNKRLKMDHSPCSQYLLENAWTFCLDYAHLTRSIFDSLPQVVILAIYAN